ncbi:MAG: hypothetical protein K0R27_741 [Xanthobacteraceae bacterium]|jgi:hypothetical protein|nr:hypothetical protein [Xanthobacteraceae bacterium]
MPYSNPYPHRVSARLSDKDMNTVTEIGRHLGHRGIIPFTDVLRFLLADWSRRLSQAEPLQ